MRATLLPLLLNGCVVAHYDDHDLRSTTLDFTTAAAIDRVMLDWETGDVRVRGGAPWADARMTLWYRWERPEVEWWVSNRTLYVRSECPARYANPCAVDLALDVPTDVELVADVITGDLELWDLDGPVRADLVTGSLAATRLGGDLDLDLTTGDLLGDDLTGADAWVGVTTGDTRLAWATPPDGVDIDVITGDVLLSVPAEVYDCDVDIVTGREVVEGIVESAFAPRSLTVRVVTGDVTILGDG